MTFDLDKARYYAVFVQQQLPNVLDEKDRVSFDLARYLAEAVDALTAARRERDEALALCQRYESAAAETSEALKAAGLPPTIPSSVKALIAERDEAEQRGRAAERADTIAWLTPRDDEEREAGQAILLRLIDCIEAGRHVGAAGKGEARCDT